MFSDLAAWLLVGGIPAIVVAVSYRYRWNRLLGAYRRLEKYTDTMLQDVQGTILNVQGIANELPAHDPIRQRIDHALERADRRLANIREQMQPLCSEQQQDSIQ
ncbi:hypothetical protein GCM10011487_49110 [Steroidobacter agaridevorans]|uniref:Uncharacterized protein n=1 Tax=Steroidobacter agaridevorans TaxID=2695856 RepID=A0A829YJ72_9GAMM|nr:hypothetical protein [Steroidobacter agaridevorans]GFE82911.1 hypothetical protein GCM10011487_49110 [Steroidobacter agaridevorans]